MKSDMSNFQIRNNLLVPLNMYMQLQQLHMPAIFDYIINLLVCCMQAFKNENDMSVQTKTTLKSYFNTGDKPTEAQFADLIDSCYSLFEYGNELCTNLPSALKYSYPTSSNKTSGLFYIKDLPEKVVTQWVVAINIQSGNNGSICIIVPAAASLTNQLYSVAMVSTNNTTENVHVQTTGGNKVLLTVAGSQNNSVTSINAKCIAMWHAYIGVSQ